MTLENKITVSLTEEDVKKIIAEYLTANGSYQFKPEDVTLHISSKWIGYGKDEHQVTYFKECLGKQVADYYQKLAVELMDGKGELFAEQERIIAEYKAQGRRSEIQDAIKGLHRNYKAKQIDIPKDLCYLTGKYREDYLHDMRICQEFAVLNRKYIAKSIIDEMGWDYEGYFETIHNYIDDENMIRKGSISAKRGELVLIPINMRDGCIVGLGKGNEDWNCSAPHGAGRIMSRHRAKEILSVTDFMETMEGIYTTSVSMDTLDEAPMAYKPMKEIVENIKDTVDILEIIKPVYNFKASEV